MIKLGASRRPASAAEIEAALARLDHAPGIYFGVDAGVPGLHPLQGTLVECPALMMRLFADGLELQVLTAWGEALMRQPQLAAWAAQPLRVPGCSPLDLLRGFMSAFAPSPDVMLIGALAFEAHRLGREPAGGHALGVLFLPQATFRRDAGGSWQAVTLSLDGTADAPAGPLPAAARDAMSRRAEVPRDDYPPGGYAQMVREALVWLNERPLVSLTLSQSYRRRVDLSPAQAFRRLREANPAPASFFLNDGTGECLLGASPDLQLVIGDGNVEALPVCGTVARGTGAVGESESLKELLDEAVDAASLAVCTDALRNDLAPLCESGSLQLLDRRRPMALATVIHTVDRLAGRLRGGCDAWDAIAATAAPVMVTGTPRSDALAAIGQLEASPRGWYGGMVVQVAADGGALAGTILRAAAVSNGVANVRTGGDLLAGSSPEREEQESRLKTLSLWRAFGLEREAFPQAGASAAIAAPGAVALMAADDPLAAALADCLAGLGVQLAAEALPTVLAGRHPTSARLASRLVAIGDAAVDLLQVEGFAVRAIAPEQGRLIRCRMSAAAPLQEGQPFIAARYLRRSVANAELRPGWSAWANEEESGLPEVLVHAQRRLACLLFRPDSLLSQQSARDLLCAALALCSAA
ncbi:MAG TPA: chorismate-binding protein [Ramlibacter sp.]|nr:chorismate-binding protein [Ramlibacter sp.]